MQHEKHAIAPFWLAAWSVTLCVGWLLPNHYRPLLAFHTDAWIAIALLIAGFAVSFRVPARSDWHSLTLLIGFLVLLPWMQYTFGLISLVGNAWLSSVYCFGLLVSILFGSRLNSDRTYVLLDGFFLAIGIASIFSVGLQLRQWLLLDGLELLTMGSEVTRPSANLGQPNQLATLLFWGTISAAWGIVRKQIRAIPAMLMSGFLLFGIALTGSRTAWIALTLILFLAWFWRRLVKDPRLVWLVAGLYLYFFLCVAVVGYFNNASGIDEISRMSSEIRPIAWAAFIDASIREPLLGYGWNQSAIAHAAVAADHPNLPAVFTYSHNLFLDLILWCGIPIGSSIILFLLLWFFDKFKKVRNAEDALLIVFLLTVANHAMLELPLYYAYFLLPTGLVMGVLNSRMRSTVIFSTGRYTLLILAILSTILLSLIIRDYSRIEASYNLLRLEWENFEIRSPKVPPDVLLLSHWHDYIKFARIAPAENVSKAELQWMHDVTALFPSSLFMHKLATVLALNNQPVEASLWLKRLCKMTPRQECNLAKEKWASQGKKNNKIAAVPWPTE